MIHATAVGHGFLFKFAQARCCLARVQNSSASVFDFLHITTSECRNPGKAAEEVKPHAFGFQELTDSGSGNQTGQSDYYSLAGHLIGSTNGSTTTYDLIDSQGSVILSLTSSAIQGEQAYGPWHPNECRRS